MPIVAFRRTCDNAQWCIKYIQSSRIGCWCHLVKWFDWSMVESNLVSQWDKRSSRWKGRAFWDLKRDRVKREDRMRLLFLACLIYLRDLGFISLTNESPWRTFNVLVHCVLQGSSLYTFPFWLKDFHLCLYNFLFPSLPHLVLMFSYGSCRPSDLSVSPCFHSFRIVWCSNFGTSSPCIYVLPDHGFSI